VLIPEHKIEEVRERVDLVALVQRHGVELKKTGRSHKGLCPFHNEKSPSFHVWGEAKRFKCFGCDAGGDAISFVQRLLGKSFVDSVRDLAKEVGVDLEAAVDPGLKEKAQLKEATDFAAQFFVQRLWDPAQGHHAREYLRNRGVSDDMMRAFGLGWAPLGWTELADRLREHGLLAFAEKAGLVGARQRQDGYYDVFRGRLMIPIRSPEGRAIAFGGRLLEGDDGPKYLNSKESRLYTKSDVLYGVDHARDEVRKKKMAVLVEGYFDAIGLHQAGLKNAVALCSTALTPGHLSLLRRLEAKEVVLLLDGDEAGRKAVERLAGPILAFGLASRVATLPSGDDPDTFARKAGPDGVATLVSGAKPLTQHLFESMVPEGAAASFENKMEAIERLKAIAQQLPVGLTRSAFFGSLSKHVALPASELETAMRGKGPAPVRAAPKPTPAEPPPPPLEAAFAAAALRDKRVLGKDIYRAALDLKHLGVRVLIGELQSGKPAEDVLYDSTEALKGALTRAADQLPRDPSQLEPFFEAVCTSLKLQAVNDQLKRLTAEMAGIPGASDLTPDARELLEERGRLLELKRELEARRKKPS
jgi:DNA primase